MNEGLVTGVHFLWKRRVVENLSFTCSSCVITTGLHNNDNTHCHFLSAFHVRSVVQCHPCRAPLNMGLSLTSSRGGRNSGSVSLCFSLKKSLLQNRQGLLSISRYFPDLKLKGITTETQGNVVTVFQAEF